MQNTTIAGTIATLAPKRWTKTDILNSFPRYNRLNFTRLIMPIYERQTAMEKSATRTLEDNGVGFNKFDAPFMTSIIDGSRRFNGALTQGQFIAAQRVMRRYAGQLAKIKNGEI